MTQPPHSAPAHLVATITELVREEPVPELGVALVQFAQHTSEVFFLGFPL